MTCRICGGATEVIDSREVEQTRRTRIDDTVRRRRACLTDNTHRATTLELWEDDIPAVQELQKELTRVKHIRTYLKELLAI
jgi:transcriptional regulator NrdR family protein